MCAPRLKVIIQPLHLFVYSLGATISHMRFCFSGVFCKKDEFELQWNLLQVDTPLTPKEGELFLACYPILTIIFDNLS